MCALTSPHKLSSRGYFIDEYYFLSTPCLSALNELSDSIQISPSRKTSMVCCMDYYTTAFKWAFFVESSIKPIVCVRPYDFSRCCDARCCVEFWRVSFPCNDTQNPRVFSVLWCSLKPKSLWKLFSSSYDITRSLLFLRLRCRKKSREIATSTGLSQLC